MQDARTDAGMHHHRYQHPRPVLHGGCAVQGRHYGWPDWQPLLVYGTVYGCDCVTPLADATVDVWQANDAGVYDNVGYTLRGHQFTDEAGRYELTTILPGIYTGRTRHIHVKVQEPDQPVLTSQLYFPDVPENASDGIFDPSLVIGEAYQARTVRTEDGRVITGLLAEDSAERVVLKTQGGKLETIAREEVVAMKVSELSLMPEGIEKQLQRQEIADLFAFITLDKHPDDKEARPIAGTPRPAR